MKNMSDVTFAKLLHRLRACGEAVLWATGKDLKTVWETCERGDWLLWLCGRMAGKDGWFTRNQVVLAACECAELSLGIFETKYPNDKRPRFAIEIARKWANGQATLQEVKDAASAVASASAAAADAAYAAADAAAYAAADAAADAIMRSQVLKQCADVVRRVLVMSFEDATSKEVA